VRGALAAARLDLADVLRSRWLVFACVVYALLAGAFVLVGLRESSVIGFTGMSRALLSFVHVLVFVLPLLALTATGQAVARARDDGVLELLLSQPISRRAYLAGVTGARYLVLAVPLVVLVLAMALVAWLAYGEAIPWGFLARSLALSSALLWAFVGIGLLVSIAVRDASRAIVGALAVWAACVLLLDLGLVGVMLQFQLNPRAVFLLASLNPVQCARMALLAGADPDLGVLGPVGFYLSTRIGDARLFALGVIWPLVVGFASLGLALRRFARSDVV
jgi:ABC-2 type transport system permease protein